MGNVNKPPVKLWYAKDTDGAVVEKFEENINNHLSLIVSGYVREVKINDDSIKLIILSYYLTFNKNSCWDNTFSRLRVKPDEIQKCLIKLSTKQFGNDWSTQIIELFESFKMCGNHFWTSHYKIYLSCINDLISYFIHNAQTNHIIKIINCLKKLILKDEYYEYKDCHEICSKFVANALSLHLTELYVENKTFHINALLNIIFDLKKEYDINSRHKTKLTNNGNDGYFANLYHEIFAYLDIIKYLNVNKHLFFKIIEMFLRWNHDYSHLMDIDMDQLLLIIYRLIRLDNNKRAFGFVILKKLIKEYKYVDLSIHATSLISGIIDILKSYEQLKNITNDGNPYESNKCIDYGFECLYEILSNINSDQLYESQFCENWAEDPSCIEMREYMKYQTYTFKKQIKDLYIRNKEKVIKNQGQNYYDEKMREDEDDNINIDEINHCINIYGHIRYVPNQTKKTNHDDKDDDDDDDIDEDDDVILSECFDFLTNNRWLTSKSLGVSHLFACKSLSKFMENEINDCYDGNLENDKMNATQNVITELMDIIKNNLKYIKEQYDENNKPRKWDPDWPPNYGNKNDVNILCIDMFQVEIEIIFQLQQVSGLSQIENMSEINEFISEIKKTKLFKTLKLCSLKKSRVSRCGWIGCRKFSDKHLLYKCKGCKWMNYCCRSHQKKHWKHIHSQQCAKPC